MVDSRVESITAPRLEKEAGPVREGPNQWIVIPNWERFQHYSDRNPVWIKLHLELTHKHEWRGLTFAERGILVGLWQEYAGSHQKLPRNTREISRRLGQKVLEKQLVALNHAGFIQFSASTPLADRYQDAMPEKEEEKEKPYLEKPAPVPAPEVRGDDDNGAGAGAGVWATNEDLLTLLRGTRR